MKPILYIVTALSNDAQGPKKKLFNVTFMLIKMVVRFMFFDRNDHWEITLSSAFDKLGQIAFLSLEKT